MLVGVLALQGAFREHEKILQSCGANTRQVRLPQHLAGLDALVIPGGESTAIGKLLVKYHLLAPIKELGQKGLPVFGTCAGLILLAKKIAGANQPALQLMDIAVARNAFGRQVDSFETGLTIPALGEPDYQAVFIRAPYIISVEPGVEVMATYQNKIVLARQNNFLAAAFHPELTNDLWLHQYFLEMIIN
ncbi:pyridoxal 5'-phosphate synthase glutaminase subunit PdxT [Peptococcaceae bacterium]|nr:pyridoxal 5'-phosphate synthase glutaminase subunit PdxT [Peptococcaceae bacterium]